MKFTVHVLCLTALFLVVALSVSAQPLSKEEEEVVVVNLLDNLRKPAEENPRICVLFQRYNDARYLEELVLADPLHHFPRVKLSSSELDTIRQTTLGQYLQALTKLLRKHPTDNGENLPIDHCSWDRPRKGITFPAIYGSWNSWSMDGLYNRYEVAKLLRGFSTEDPISWRESIFWDHRIARIPETDRTIEQYAIEAAPALTWLWQHGDKHLSWWAGLQLRSFVQSDRIQSTKLKLTLEQTGQLIEFIYDRPSRWVR